MNHFDHYCGQNNTDNWQNDGQNTRDGLVSPGDELDQEIMTNWEGKGPQLRGNTMHESRNSFESLHREVAEYHDLAAQAHRTAAEHNEKGDNATGNWHLERAREYSDQAFKLAHDVHSKSGRMESL